MVNGFELCRVGFFDSLCLFIFSFNFILFSVLKQTFMSYLLLKCDFDFAHSLCKMRVSLSQVSNSVTVRQKVMLSILQQVKAMNKSYMQTTHQSCPLAGHSDNIVYTHTQITMGSLLVPSHLTLYNSRNIYKHPALHLRVCDRILHPLTGRYKGKFQL